MATRKYTRITYKNRQEIENLCKTDMKKPDIAKQFGISRGTLYQELNRGLNEVGEYEALLAQKNYCSTPKE